MNKKIESTIKTAPSPAQSVKKPNEAGSFYIESHVKIFDPTTQEVYVEKRA